jgi:hypothetical protein
LRLLLGLCDPIQAGIITQSGCNLRRDRLGPAVHPSPRVQGNGNTGYSGEGELSDRSVRLENYGGAGALSTICPEIPDAVLAGLPYPIAQRGSHRQRVFFAPLTPPQVSLGGTPVPPGRHRRRTRRSPELSILQLIRQRRRGAKLGQQSGVFDGGRSDRRKHGAERDDRLPGTDVGIDQRPLSLSSFTVVRYPASKPVAKS